MINTFFGAKLVNYNTIRVAIFSDVPRSDPLFLIIDDDICEELKIVRQSFLNGICLIECRTKFPIVLGKEYVVRCRNFGMCSLNVNDATSFDHFDEEYFYAKNDLGATYSREQTTFKVWAPLASKVSLFIRKKETEVFKTYKMIRGQNGVFEITLKGDYDGYFYRYLVTNSGLAQLTTDPYAKGSSANGKDSCVIDPEQIKVDLSEKKLPTYKDYTDTIIYELNVRDFTIDKSTNIQNKGKYLGLTEEGRKTKDGNKAGLDYLEDLGITHVQLLPIYDFKTVDELNPDKEYNWGYDPQQYFVPEGSYSTNPNNGYTRVIEIKKMIQAIHKKGIKVNMDVVFNHVYSYENSVFEKIVPNYYFRKNSNGTMCNGSGCGNDLATERKMVRKLIIDSLIYWVKEYGIDGFRFDLMGLIDIDTIKIALKEVRKLKPDAMIYGEGWDMYTNLSKEKKTTILNSDKVADVAFFNDAFRDIVRGNNDLANFNCGYLLGNTNYLEGFKFVTLGSCVDYCYNPRFISANQSINYLECHDNCTLFDKITAIHVNESEDIKFKILKMANFSVLFSFGIPFIHAGQEIGLSKQMHDNTYNEGDKYNKFDYSILDERIDLFNYLKSLIQLRKSMNLQRFVSNNSDTIEDTNYFENLDNDALAIYLSDPNGSERKFNIYYNPTEEDLKIQFDEYNRLIVCEKGYIKDCQKTLKEITISPYCVYVFEGK
ncbi:MAG: type I pullulanase [Bacilli bacterium]|nr:type I pullulanase [Bacilli bacterium]